MINLLFEIEDNKIIIKEKKYLTTGSYKQIECNFEFLTNEWDELQKTVIFVMNNVTYNQTLINNKCYIPAESIKNKGKLYIGVYGVQKNQELLEKRYTTGLIEIEVNDGSYKNGLEPTIPEIYKLENIKTDIDIIATKTLEFSVDKNEIRETTKQYLTTGAYKQFDCKFNFSNDWDNLNKIAIFISNGVPYCQTLISDKCYIPSDVLEISGNILIGVFGTIVENNILIKRNTTGLYSINIFEGSYKKGISPSIPELNIWEQYIAEMENILNQTNSILCDAQNLINNFKAEDVKFTDGKTFQEKYDTGELKGERGERGERGETYDDTEIKAYKKMCEVNLLSRNLYNKNGKTNGIHNFLVRTALSNGAIGGNIFSTIYYPSRCITYLKANSNKTYTVNCLGTGFYIYIVLADSSGNIIKAANVQEKEELSFTTIENVTYVEISYRKIDNSNFTDNEAELLKNSIQIEEGTNITEHVEYANIVEDSKLYITTGAEFATNEYIDGKRVYGKRFNCGKLPNAGGKDIETGLIINNLNIVEKQVVAESANAIAFPESIQGLSVNISKIYNTIVLVTTRDLSMYSLKLTLYYTKN